MALTTTMTEEDEEAYLFWSVCYLIKDTLSTRVPVAVGNNQSNIKYQYETPSRSSALPGGLWRYSRWSVLQDERCGGKRLKLQVLPSPGSRGKPSTRGLVQVLLPLFLWPLHKEAAAVRDLNPSEPIMFNRGPTFMIPYGYRGLRWDIVWDGLFLSLKAALQYNNYCII